jgi:hypothetical protein
MFRYLLTDSDGQPYDPSTLVSAIPNWSPDEVITFGTGHQARIVAIDTELNEKIIEAGFRALFVVEQV